MSQKRRNPRWVWNLLLAAHLLIYVMLWLFAVYTLLFRGVMAMGYTEAITIALFWLPVLALHVIIYANSARSITPDAERQAYREGFADAVERFADRNYDERLLALDDEGELVEMEATRKRR